jgi:hypothetical protein
MAMMQAHPAGMGHRRRAGTGDTGTARQLSPWPSPIARNGRPVGQMLVDMSFIGRCVVPRAGWIVRTSKARAPPRCDTRTASPTASVPLPSFRPPARQLESRRVPSIRAVVARLAAR